MGSLLVAIIEASKNMVQRLRESDDGGGILLCLAKCLLSCLQDILEVSDCLGDFMLIRLFREGAQ